MREIERYTIQWKKLRDVQFNGRGWEIYNSMEEVERSRDMQFDERDWETYNSMEEIKRHIIQWKREEMYIFIEQVYNSVG